MVTPPLPPAPILLRANNLTFEALTLSAPGAPSDAPLVLLLHGFPQFGDSWLPVMHTLAAAGFRAVAVNQRGYSTGARPPDVSAYAVPNLIADVLAFADALVRTEPAPRFHLAGHDWGGAVAWAVAAVRPDRIRTLTVLSTPHLDAFSAALKSDPAQRRLSTNIPFFRAPFHLAEKVLLAFQGKLLRAIYSGKLPQAQIDANLHRLSIPGALTAALNWYRGNSFGSGHIGPVSVPALYLWGDRDQALGETAALATASHCSGPYRFERLPAKSHWLLEECPEQVASLMLKHLTQSEESSSGP
jgi:pimeloyl-ACP methyl ester carboxylesterase